MKSLKSIILETTDGDYQIDTHLVKMKTLTSIERKFKDQNIVAIIRIDEDQFMVFVEIEWKFLGIAAIKYILPVNRNSFMILILPLEVYYSKNKKFILNLNNYRNAHYRILSASKKIYTEDLLERIKDLPKFSDVVSLEYVYYAKSKRRLDVSNPCSIIDKFTCDALVKAEIIEDDSSKQIKKVSYIFGGVDKNNPRCELTIKCFPLVRSKDEE